MTHLDFDRISEFAESGEPNAASREARHLAECAECRDTLRRVHELLLVARALPRDVAPPPEVWVGLRDRVARRKPARAWSVGRWVAAAAAVVLLAGTAVILPIGRNGNIKAKAKGATLTAFDTSAAAVLTVEKRYALALDDLRETLASQRAALAPSTVSVVDRSLATIDTAIAETRSALTSDPENRALVDILASHYERKVDLLQRATELAPSF
jgi:predicted anti-sigma-YlaC factor YlaD